MPYTRIIEHKHFEFGTQPTTIISREYSSEWKPGVEPYYPVNNDKNNAVYAVIAPVSALLSAKMSESRVIAFPELGMEALYLIKVDKYPAVIAAAHGRSIYE